LPLVLVMLSLFCPLPCLRGVLEFAPSVNSSTPRRHGSGQNNKNITNARGKLEHSTKTWKWTNNENITNSLELVMFSLFVHFHVFVECSSLPLVLVMFSLFCPLPCLRGVLEFVPSVSNVLIILSTSMSSWSARVCP
jgi:hypothetical protein